MKFIQRNAVALMQDYTLAGGATLLWIGSVFFITLAIVAG